MFTKLNGVAINEILPLDAPELIALRFSCGKLTPAGQVSFEAHCSQPPASGFIDVLTGPKGMLVLSNFETLEKPMEVIGLGKGQQSVSYYLQPRHNFLYLVHRESLCGEKMIVQTPHEKGRLLMPENLPLLNNNVFDEAYRMIEELTGLYLPALPPHTLLHRFEITGPPMSTSEKSQWNLNLKIAYNYNEKRGEKVTLQQLIKPPARPKKWWRFW
jgi:hypothetical protein